MKSGNGRIALSAMLNNNLSVLDDDEHTPVYNDDDGNEITGEIFESIYLQEFTEIIASGFDELESRIENNTSPNNSTSYSSDSSVFSRVKAIVVDKLRVEPYEVVESASFMNDLGADSLDAVELIMEFEKEFGIIIPDEKAERIRTVGDAVRLLEKNI